MNHPKIGLGSVQFGLNYGVSNRLGKTTSEVVVTILKEAFKKGVRIIDTAPSYGDSEAALGKSAIREIGFHVITKTPHFKEKVISPRAAELLRSTFLRSLELLRLDSVYGLLVHGVDDLFKSGADTLLSMLHDLRDEGLVDRIGASTYTPSQIDKLINYCSVDIIQVPINVFDQRLLGGGQLQRLNSDSVEIHARSPFLQGVLLSEPEDLPAYFSQFSLHLRNYRKFLRAIGLTPVEAAVGFVRALSEVGVIICGVNSLDQLKEILETDKITLDSTLFEEFALKEPKLIDPTQWKL